MTKIGVKLSNILRLNPCIFVRGHIEYIYQIMNNGVTLGRFYRHVYTLQKRKVDIVILTVTKEKKGRDN